MLVLTRRITERLFINGTEIIITVLGINGNQVRLGIEAPKETPIHREEVYNRIMDEKKEESEKSPVELFLDRLKKDAKPEQKCVIKIKGSKLK